MRTRIVSRVRNRPLPCSSLWSVERAVDRGPSGHCLEQTQVSARGEGPITHTAHTSWLTNVQGGRKLEDGRDWCCESAQGQAQARSPQEGTLGSRL